MNAHLFLTFCTAAVILILIPGPVVTLVVANSLSHGARTGLATVAGTSIGNTLLVAIAAAGLVTVFSLLSEVFAIVRWAGAAYLIWLGVKSWRAHGGQRQEVGTATAQRSALAVFVQGFVVAITNPKTIVFYIAFLPQFVDPHLPAGPQLLAMSCAMVTIAVTFDSMYALLAGRLRTWFTSPRRRRLQGRFSGILLIGTGCGLLLARRGG